MKLKQRLLSYLILLIAYPLITFALLYMAAIINTKEILTLVVGGTLFNIVYAFIALKLHPILNILAAVVVTGLSLYLAIAIGDMGLISSDAYGIMTAITCNCILPLFFWELLYQIKIRLLNKDITI